MKKIMILTAFIILNLIGLNSYANSICENHLSNPNNLSAPPLALDAPSQPAPITAGHQPPFRTSFPRGFWKDKSNLDILVRLILTHRKSAFLSSLKDDLLEDVQADFSINFGVTGITGKRLSTNITSLKLASDWAAALSRAGHPKDLKEESQLRVIEIIKFRNKHKLPLTAIAVISDDSELYLAKISEVFGSLITSSAFVQRAETAFGSWPKAVLASKVNYNFKESSSVLTQTDIKKLLLVLKSKKVNLNTKAFRESTDQDTLTIIKNFLAKDFSPSQIYTSAIRFKPWSAWLKEIDFLPTRMNRTNVSGLNLDQVIVGLQTLHQHKVSLNSLAIQKDNSRKTSRIILTTLGFKLTGSTFYHYALDLNKTWDELIELAGLNIDQIKKYGLTLTDVQIIKTIQLLNSEGVLLNVSSINRDDSTKTSAAIKKALGYTITGKHFYGYVSKKDRSWDEWLILSGLDPNQIRRSGYNFTEAEIVNTILSLYQMGVPINAKSINRDTSEETKSIILSSLGVAMTGSGFYSHVMRRKVTWPEWLSKAGLDVTKIQLTGKIPYHLVNRITQMSLEQMHSNRYAMLGDGHAYEFGSDDYLERVQLDRMDGESLLIQKQFEDEFSTFNEMLSAEEQLILEHLIDGIERDLDLPEIIFELISANKIASSDDLQNLFLKVKKHKRFLELFR